MTCLVKAEPSVESSASGALTSYNEACGTSLSVRVDLSLVILHMLIFLSFLQIGSSSGGSSGGSSSGGSSSGGSSSASASSPSSTSTSGGSSSGSSGSSGSSSPLASKSGDAVGLRMTVGGLAAGIAAALLGAFMGL